MWPRFLYHFVFCKKIVFIQNWDSKRHATINSNWKKLQRKVPKSEYGRKLRCWNQDCYCQLFLSPSLFLSFSLYFFFKKVKTGHILTKWCPLSTPASHSWGPTAEHICPGRFSSMIFRGQVIDKNSGAFCGEDYLWDNHLCIKTNLQQAFIFQDSLVAVSTFSVNTGWQNEHWLTK